MPRPALVSLAAWSLCALVSAQEIRVNVTEVVVPVTVTDANGRFVTGLKREQFKVLDQGIPQDIKFFSAEGKHPTVVGFLMDRSSSMRTHWKTYQENAVNMVANLMTAETGYRGYLVGAGTEAELLVDATDDPEKIAAHLNRLSAGGGAALADALYLACARRDSVPGQMLEPRRAIVVFGSGLDTSLTHSLDEVIELALRNAVTIYAVSTDRYGIASENSSNLERLVKATGGRVEYPLQNTYDNTPGFLPHPENPGNRVFTDGTGGYTNAMETSLAKSIAAIAGRIQQQYILRYVPHTPGDGSAKHSLWVEVDIPTLKVTTRTHYYIR